MPSGRYKIQDGVTYPSPVPAKGDNSFYYCICTMLIFVALLLLIMAMAILLPYLLKGNNNNIDDAESIKGEASYQYGKIKQDERTKQEERSFKSTFRTPELVIPEKKSKQSVITSSPTSIIPTSPLSSITTQTKITMIYHKETPISPTGENTKIEISSIATTTDPKKSPITFSSNEYSSSKFNKKLLHATETTTEKYLSINPRATHSQSTIKSYKTKTTVAGIIPTSTSTSVPYYVLYPSETTLSVGLSNKTATEVNTTEPTDTNSSSTMSSYTSKTTTSEVIPTTTESFVPHYVSHPSETTTESIETDYPSSKSSYIDEPTTADIIPPSVSTSLSPDSSSVFNETTTEVNTTEPTETNSSSTMSSYTSKTTTSEVIPTTTESFVPHYVSHPSETTTESIETDYPSSKSSYIDEPTTADIIPPSVSTSLSPDSSSVFNETTTEVNTTEPTETNSSSTMSSYTSKTTTSEVIPTTTESFVPHYVSHPSETTTESIETDYPSSKSSYIDEPTTADIIPPSVSTSLSPDSSSVFNETTTEVNTTEPTETNSSSTMSSYTSKTTTSEVIPTTTESFVPHYVSHPSETTTESIETDYPSSKSSYIDEPTTADIIPPSVSTSLSPDSSSVFNETTTEVNTTEPTETNSSSTMSSYTSKTTTSEVISTTTESSVPHYVSHPSETTTESIETDYPSSKSSYIDEPTTTDIIPPSVSTSLSPDSSSVFNETTTEVNTTEPTETNSSSTMSSYTSKTTTSEVIPATTERFVPHYVSHPSETTTESIETDYPSSKSSYIDEPTTADIIPPSVSTSLSPDSSSVFNETTTEVNTTEPTETNSSSTMSPYTSKTTTSEVIPTTTESPVPHYVLHPSETTTESIETDYPTSKSSYIDEPTTADIIPPSVSTSLSPDSSSVFNETTTEVNTTEPTETNSSSTMSSYTSKTTTSEVIPTTTESFVPHYVSHPSETTTESIETEYPSSKSSYIDEPTTTDIIPPSVSTSLSPDSSSVFNETTTEVNTMPPTEIRSVSTMSSYTTKKTVVAVFTNSENTTKEQCECPPIKLEEEGPKLCETNLCKNEAGNILSKMNHSFDYCQDFHEYACGNMRQSKLLLEDNPNDLIISIIKDTISHINYSSESNEEKYIKQFYDSCMMYVNVPEDEKKKKGRELLNSIGLMYTEPENISSNTFTIPIISLIELGSFPLFDIGLDVNDEESTRLVPVLTLTSEGAYLFSSENEKENKCRNVIKNKSFSLDETYLDYLLCMRNYSEYKKIIGEALSAFNLFPNSEAVHIANVLQDVEDILIGLFYKTRDKPEIINKRISLKKYESITVEFLQSKYNVINWKYLLRSLLKTDIEDNTRVQVYFDEYFINVFTELSDTTKLWKVHNALLAHFAYNIYKYFFKTKNPCDRETYCVQMTSRLLPDITSNIFMNTIDNITLHEQEKEVEKWHYLIRDTLLEEVNEVFHNSSNWLDNESLEAIKYKINSFKISIPKHFSRSNPKENFEKFSVNDDYLSNAMSLSIRRQNLKYSAYKMTSDSHYVLWLLFSRSYSSESIYIYGINTLIIPEGILLKHNKKLPDSINVARLGFVIAKGLSKAFDMIGIDDKNNKRKVLTSSSYKTFEFALHSFEAGEFDFAQSHSEEHKKYQFVISTSLTLNDRFSDIGATKLALETLRRQGQNSSVLPWGGFSNEQLYYITLAQMFCTKKKVPDLFPTLYEKETLPSFLRLKTMFSNIEEFDTSFPCALGVPMRQTKDLMLYPFPYLNHGDHDYDAYSNF